MKKLTTLALSIAFINVFGQAKISQLPTTATITGSELIPVVQSGVTKQTTAAQLANLAVISGTNYVPYTGATSSVNLGTNSFSVGSNSFFGSLSYTNSPITVINTSSANTNWHTIISNGTESLASYIDNSVTYKGAWWGTNSNHNFHLFANGNGGNTPALSVLKDTHSPVVINGGSTSFTSNATFKINQSGSTNVFQVRNSTDLTTWFNISNTGVITMPLNTFSLGAANLTGGNSGTVAVLSDITSPIIFSSATSGAYHTGTTARTAIRSVLIPANTFTVGDFIHVYNSIVKTTTAADYSARIFINTTNTHSGATLLATYASVSTGATTLAFDRLLAVKSSTITEVLAAGSTFLSFTGIGINVNNNPNINWTVDQYLIITVDLLNSSDSVYSSTYLIKKEN